MILFGIPESRRVGRQHLIDQDHLTAMEPELELRIRQDESRFQRALRAKPIQGKAEPFERLGQLATGPVGELGRRNVFVMARRRLGGRRKDRLGQPVTLSQSPGQRLTSDGSGALVVLPA